MLGKNNLNDHLNRSLFGQSQHYFGSVKINEHHSYMKTTTHSRTRTRTYILPRMQRQKANHEWKFTLHCQCKFHPISDSLLFNIRFVQYYTISWSKPRSSTHGGSLGAAAELHLKTVSFQSYASFSLCRVFRVEREFLGVQAVSRPRRSSLVDNWSWVYKPCLLGPPCPRRSLLWGKGFGEATLSSLSLYGPVSRFPRPSMLLPFQSASSWCLAASPLHAINSSQCNGE